MPWVTLSWVQELSTNNTGKDEGVDGQGYYLERGEREGRRRERGRERGSERGERGEMERGGREERGKESYGSTVCLCSYLQV